MTRRFLQHLLLISLARTILTVIGRGRAWDEWDEGKLVEPAQQRSHRSRFVQTLSFGALFLAGLAFSAGAGNTVQSLVDNGSAVSADSGASGPSGPTGATGVTDAPKSAEAAPATPAAPAAPVRVAQAQAAAAPARPVAAPPQARTAVQSAAPAVSRPVVAGSTAATKTAAVATRRASRPSRTVQRARPQAKPRHRTTAPKVQAKPPALDPEVHDFPAATVWLNRAAPDPTPPAARLKLSFARELVSYSRQAHVDWALVLATLRAEGRNGRMPAGRVELRTLSTRLAATGGRVNPWAAALAYSSDSSLADRVVALRHYYRAVGLPALVDGLLSQKADLQDRVLHDMRLHIYSGGRNDIAAGHVDVRVLATMLYLADTFHEVTVSCLISGHRLYARPGVVSAHIYGRAMDVAALNGVSIYGHQQPGGITEQAVRALLMLPGGMEPAQVISLLGMGGPSFALANHYDHIHVGY
ncbi:MAG TPA: hypothetical protein VLD16_00745 [Gaiellaceae bacterium]|nr:hypothetical protein [Gaiellaceae bacterium]